ncbi:MAG: hypothetical protein M1827_003171 [Pycnora praestabilis]|nr:MAG: hypothetical protein M1827_003171 [Pycnora praestabilis]
MLLSLAGMMGNAAAAHRHEFSIPQTNDTILYCSPSTVLQSITQQIHLPSVSSSKPEPRLLGSPLGSPLPSSIRALPITGMNKRTGSVKFVDQEVDSSTDEDLPGLISQNSGAIALPTIKSRVSRAKTTFQLAHPPRSVKHRQRFSVKPKLLLQLQQLSASERPDPALDVLPATVFAPLLARKFPKVFGGKDRLGSHDLVIIRSEDYRGYPLATQDADDSDEKRWAREVIATICQMRKDEGGAKGKVEICLNRGPSWTGTPLLNGGYELLAVDDDGAETTARWVPRSITGRRTSSNSYNGRDQDNQWAGNNKFNFSIINPKSRRHPIIASMAQSTIDILDEYPSISPSLAARSPSIREDQGSYFQLPRFEEQPMTQTDEHLRALIVVTGIWVAFRQNWSENFQYDDSMSPSPSGACQSRSNSVSSRRTTPPGFEQGERCISGSPTNSGHHCNSLQSVGGKVLRTGSHMLHHSTTSTTDLESSGGGPRRTSSTGTAFMQKRNTRSISLQSNAQRVTSMPDISIDLTPSEGRQSTGKNTMESRPLPANQSVLADKPRHERWGKLKGLVGLGRRYSKAS